MLVDHPMIHQILKLNPMYYIVSGYRDAFHLGRTWSDGTLALELYFWVSPGAAVLAWQL